MTTTETDWKSALIGRQLKGAFSSLTEFSCETDGDYGLVLRAVESANGPSIQAQLVENANLPRSNDAVCRVDWSWIENSTVDEVIQTASSVRFRLSPAGPLSIAVQVWQGKPFLAFQPYKAPKQ